MTSCSPFPIGRSPPIRGGPRRRITRMTRALGSWARIGDVELMPAVPAPPPQPSPTRGEGARLKTSSAREGGARFKPSPLVGEGWVGGASRGPSTPFHRSGPMSHRYESGTVAGALALVLVLALGHASVRPA